MVDTIVPTLVRYQGPVAMLDTIAQILAHYHPVHLAPLDSIAQASVILLQLLAHLVLIAL